MFQSVYKNKKVLVTGNTGFKGVWLSIWLDLLGAKVVGLSNSTSITQPNHYEASGVDQVVQTYECDIQDINHVQEIIVEENPDYIFHLAAQALVKDSYDNPVDTYATNAIGTANVLTGLSKLENCVAVLITSDKCYENIETFYGYKENDQLGGADPYSASKAAAEIFISSYWRSFLKQRPEIQIAITRAGNVIGGGDWAANRLVPDVVKAWHEKEPVTIRRPDATRPWQHVLEPLSGYLHLGSQLTSRPNLDGEAFNFGPPASSINPVRDVVINLQKILTELELNIDESQANFHEAGLLKLCCDKALTYLNWQPVLNFQQTMKFTADWYKKFYTEKPDEKTLMSYTRLQIEDYCQLAESKSLTWTENGK